MKLWYSAIDAAGLAPALALFKKLFRAFALRRTRLVNEIRKSCNIHKAILYHFGVKSSPSPYSH
jgi:hypothetical protein